MSDKAETSVSKTADRELSAEQLRNKYGGNWEQHPDYPVEDWQYEVGNDDTRLGYWEWLAHRIEEGG